MLPCGFFVKMLITLRGLPLFSSSQAGLAPLYWVKGELTAGHLDASFWNSDSRRWSFIWPAQESPADRWCAGGARLLEKCGGLASPSEKLPSLRIGPSLMEPALESRASVWFFSPVSPCFPLSGLSKPLTNFLLSCVWPLGPGAATTAEFVGSFVKLAHVLFISSCPLKGCRSPDPWRAVPLCKLWPVLVRILWILSDMSLFSTRPACAHDPSSRFVWEVWVAKTVSRATDVFAP